MTETIRDTWRSPPTLLHTLLQRGYRFNWDLAASHQNHVAPNFFTIEDDSLRQDWNKLDGHLWCNPPFSRLEEFTKKADDWSHSPTPAFSTLIMLLPAHRTEQAWFHDNVLQSAQLVFLRKRVNYIAPPGISSSSAQFPSMLAIYGNRPMSCFGLEHR